MPELPVSSHAITRYKERVKPALDWEDAKWELENLVRIGEFTPWPSWSCCSNPDSRFLGLSDGLGGVVDKGMDDRPIVTTVIVRGTLRPSERAGRNKGRARRKSARLTRSKSFARKHSKRPEAPEWD